MKTINQLITAATDQQPVQKAPESPPRLETTEQVCDFINSLFRALKGCYPAWRQAFSTEQEYRDARLMWTRAMAEAGIGSMEQVRMGVSRARQDPSDFMPGPGKFIQWCRPSAADMGMPDAAAAWSEVVQNSHHIFEHPWSHPGVYEAGRRVGWFEIRTGKDKRKEFEREYQKVISECVAGAVFDMPGAQGDGLLIECHRNGSEVRTEQNKAAAADALAKLRKATR